MARPSLNTQFLTDSNIRIRRQRMNSTPLIFAVVRTICHEGGATWPPASSMIRCSRWAKLRRMGASFMSISTVNTGGNITSVNAGTPRWHPTTLAAKKKTTMPSAPTTLARNSRPVNIMTAQATFGMRHVACWADPILSLTLPSTSISPMSSTSCCCGPAANAKASSALLVLDLRKCPSNL